MRSRRGMHSTTLDVTRKQRQFLPFTNVRHNLASNFWCLNSILFLGFSWGYQLSYLLDLSSTSIPPPLKYQVSRRWRAHVVFKMSSSKSFDILPDVEKALTGGIGEGFWGHWGGHGRGYGAYFRPLGPNCRTPLSHNCPVWQPFNLFPSLWYIFLNSFQFIFISFNDILSTYLTFSCPLGKTSSPSESLRRLATIHIPLDGMLSERSFHLSPVIVILKFGQLVHNC